MADQRFPKRVRLLRPPEFQRVFDARCVAEEGALRLFAAANDLGHPRLGLVVSRKVGSAVERNRWKRMLREAFRFTQGKLPPLDLVCCPYGHALPNLQQLVIAIPRLADQLAQRIERRRERHDHEPERLRSESP